MYLFIELRGFNMSDRVADLIQILLDNTAREDERHDAAMDISEFDDDRALFALLKIGSNPKEDNIILDACGESIAEILVRRGFYNKELIDKLAPIAQATANAYIKAQRPKWLDLPPSSFKK
jgi:hypothetical protein